MPGGNMFDFHIIVSLANSVISLHHLPLMLPETKRSPFVSDYLKGAFKGCDISAVLRILIIVCKPAGRWLVTFEQVRCARDEQK